MARTNYSLGKRQRELSKQQKKEEKRQRKLERKNEDQGSEGTVPSDETPDPDRKA